MRILLIKLTSLGDIVHAFPALTDAMAAIPGLRVDWLIEESYAELASQHPVIENAIPVPYRKVRRLGFGAAPEAFRQWRALQRQWRAQQYDLILDAQGLVKSANLVFLNRAPATGFDFQSAREPLAALFYGTRIRVAKDQHAIARQRQLFAKALDYPVNAAPPQYALEAGTWRAEAGQILRRFDLPNNYLMFLHGSAWSTKTWPEQSWRRLAEEFDAEGVNILLPWGNSHEHDRARRISDNLPHIHVLPKLSLIEVGKIISMAKAVAGVDSGLGHIAAAFDIPGLVLIGPTDPELIGHFGECRHMIVSDYPLAPCYRRHCSDADREQCCMAAISVDQVSVALHETLAKYDRNRGPNSGQEST